MACCLLRTAWGVQPALSCQVCCCPSLLLLLLVLQCLAGLLLLLLTLAWPLGPVTSAVVTGCLLQALQLLHHRRCCLGLTLPLQCCPSAG